MDWFDKLIDLTEPWSGIIVGIWMVCFMCKMFGIANRWFWDGIEPTDDDLRLFPKWRPKAVNGSPHSLPSNME